ncbi:helix-turn-helix domain-containing protein [Clostridium luticellarii]|jgi:transcriptional regulator with XRE-family HTH domain|uniref:Anaerobic benzoate catabolism transcriptional regulator n=1 Tax=Clostridium luticellarii TaxID=1691940 RepID=A0A2T0BP17_9CLOT|nr:S24 family peptidase [Clostridium luticellarii]MCI1944617.1 helix-turn-helix domain-containing protein [Clostridium luticellarii]MCI1968116.1 helix-turn-helix domain-containing protein [Clostridium luticellarii]MCI1994771.1 helix-turn-helix domain-containing protein [Clostridium luticellarii]MCI2039003.1 helix-turn-helix domain-containing protein [Clostridium luticellarii]PRR85621.1 anaerobic benzoate catabolism transcriptional regulator [Clostridium luticellarii]
MSRIGEKIKSARIKSGISQKKLARKLGVSEGFVNEVEMGRRIANQGIIDRISKILGKDMNDITMSFEEQSDDVKKEEFPPISNREEKVKDIWNEAFGSVLKKVPIYKYDLGRPIGFKQLPLIENKIEGYSQDKVLYLKIESDDMEGFRIHRGDLAFAHITGEIENNVICLVEYHGGREIRQIKKLDSNKVLLISGNNTVRTESVDIGSLKVIAKLDKVEIVL